MGFDPQLDAYGHPSGITNKQFKINIFNISAKTQLSNHASAQSVERTTLNRVSSQKTGTGRGFDPQTSLKLDIHRVLYCPVTWSRFFAFFLIKNTPPSFRYRNGVRGVGKALI